MKQAVGTSLFIIFINSLTVCGDLIALSNYKLLFIILVMALLGCLSNSNIQKKLIKQNLAFGFVLIMGIYIIVTELFSHKGY
jgi:uncharacterized membrane protein YfcA